MWENFPVHGPNFGTAFLGTMRLLGAILALAFSNKNKSEENAPLGG